MTTTYAVILVKTDRKKSHFYDVLGPFEIFEMKSKPILLFFFSYPQILILLFFFPVQITELEMFSETDRRGKTPQTRVSEKKTTSKLDDFFSKNNFFQKNRFFVNFWRKYEFLCR